MLERVQSEEEYKANCVEHTHTFFEKLLDVYQTAACLHHAVKEANIVAVQAFSRQQFAVSEKSTQLLTALNRAASQGEYKFDTHLKTIDDAVVQSLGNGSDAAWPVQTVLNNAHTTLQTAFVKLLYDLIHQARDPKKSMAETARGIQSLCQDATNALCAEQDVCKQKILDYAMCEKACILSEKREALHDRFQHWGELSSAWRAAYISAFSLGLSAVPLGALSGFNYFVPIAGYSLMALSPGIFAAVVSGIGLLLGVGVLACSMRLGSFVKRVKGETSLDQHYLTKQDVVLAEYDKVFGNLIKKIQQIGNSINLEAFPAELLQINLGDNSARQLLAQTPSLLLRTEPEPELQSDSNKVMEQPCRTPSPSRQIEVF